MGTNKKKIQYSLVFNRKRELNSFGEALIQIRAYQNPKCRYFSTGIYVKPEHWDDRNKKIKHTHPSHFIYNKRITELCQEIEAFEIKMINRLGVFPLCRLHEYQRKQQFEEPISFTAFFESELRGSQMKWGSLKMYHQTFNKLKAFREVIYFEEINYTMVLDFDRFLFNQGLSVNTVKKHHHRLKTIVLRAVKCDLVKVDDNPYKKFRPKSAEPIRTFLSQEELTRIEQLEFSEKESHLARIRDIFLLSAWTGLRFSDVSRLRGKNIEETKDGLVINIKAEKTQKSIQIHLHFLFRDPSAAKSKPELLLEKYYDQVRPLGPEGDEIPLFRITNQYLNRGLKIIARRASVTKNITAHVGRRTFATIMATKVKAPVLQKLLQHARPDMTNIYIRLSNKVVIEELRKVSWK